MPAVAGTLEDRMPMSKDMLIIADPAHQAKIPATFTKLLKDNGYFGTNLTPDHQLISGRRDFYDAMPVIIVTALAETGSSIAPNLLENLFIELNEQSQQALTDLQQAGLSCMVIDLFTYLQQRTTAQSQAST